MKYILIGYNLEGASISDEAGFFQPVTIVVGIDGDAKGFSQTSPVVRMKLDPSLSITDAIAALPDLLQGWVDANYNAPSAP